MLTRAVYRVLLLSTLAVLSAFALSSRVISFDFQTTYQVTFRQTGVGPDFSGIILVVDGVDYHVTDLPLSFTWVDQSTHAFAFASPLTVQASAKQYAWNGSRTGQNGSILVYGSGNVTGKYMAQFYMTIQSPYGTRGGEGWYNQSTLAFATLDTGIVDYENGTRCAFINWGGDADGTDYAPSFPMTMDKPCIALANWRTEHYLKVETDPANISIIPGEGWYDVSTNVSLATTPVTDYLFGYWDIDGIAQGKGVDPITVSMNTTHTATAHYDETPPQAAFTCSPLDPYVNGTVTFNASASTAGGSKDTIVMCKWNFGDGTPEINQTTFTVTHVFAQVDNYNVTLNITNSRGIWSVTSKVVIILPPDEPTADFMWYPATPKARETVTFDAAMSRPGYNGTHYLPIVNYTWNFGDYNITSATDTSVAHEYNAYGDFNVTLKVTDANGLNSNVTKTVRVRPTGLTGDVNGDGTVDIYDAILLAATYDSKLGDPNWNSNADFNNDGMVDIYDAIILSGNFGKQAKHSFVWLLTSYWHLPERISESAEWFQHGCMVRHRDPCARYT